MMSVNPYRMMFMTAISSLVLVHHISSTKINCDFEGCIPGKEFCDTSPISNGICRNCLVLREAFNCAQDNSTPECLIISCNEEELQASNDQCELEAKNGNRTIISLMDENRDLKRTKNTMNRTIMDLNQKNADLNQKNADLNQKNADLHQRNADLNQKNANLNQKNADLIQKNADLIQKNADKDKEINIYMYVSGGTAALIFLFFGVIIICYWRRKGKSCRYKKDSNPTLIYVSGGDRDEETDQLMDHEDKTQSNPGANQEEMQKRMGAVVKQNKAKKSVKELTQSKILDAEVQTKVKECPRNASAEETASPQTCNNQLPEIDSMMTHETPFNLEASQEEIGELETEPSIDEVIKRKQTQNFQTLEEKQQTKIKELHSNAYAEGTAMPHIRNLQLPNHPETKQDADPLPPNSQNAPIQYQLPVQITGSHRQTPGQHTARNPSHQAPVTCQNTICPHPAIYIINQNTSGNNNQSASTQGKTGDATNYCSVKHVESVDVTNEHETCDENKGEERSDIAENSLSNIPRVRADTLSIPVQTDDQSAPTCVFDVPDFPTKF